MPMLKLLGIITMSVLAHPNNPQQPMHIWYVWARRLLGMEKES